MTTADLLPCPFCNHAAAMEPPTMRFGWSVHCTNLYCPCDAATYKWRVRL